MRITREDTHFPVASQARQSLPVELQKSLPAWFHIIFPLTTEEELLQMTDINSNMINSTDYMTTMSSYLEII